MTDSSIVQLKPLTEDALGALLKQDATDLLAQAIRIDVSALVIRGVTFKHSSRFAGDVLTTETYHTVARLRVKLDIKDRDDSDSGQVVWIVLRDTSVADALHPTVAETKGIIEAGGETELTLDLPDNALLERHRYSLWAHVDHVGDGAIHPGDLITTENIPVVPSDTAEGADAVQVRLQRI